MTFAAFASPFETDFLGWGISESMKAWKLRSGSTNCRFQRVRAIWVHPVSKQDSHREGIRKSIQSMKCIECIWMHWNIQKCSKICKECRAWIGGVWVFNLMHHRTHSVESSVISQSVLMMSSYLILYPLCQHIPKSPNLLFTWFSLSQLAECHVCTAVSLFFPRVLLSSDSPKLLRAT